jgi:hypothetical protein
VPLVEVSVGELLDKWSILEIKLIQFESNEKKGIIRIEMTMLEGAVSDLFLDEKVKDLYSELKNVNLEIWKGMDLLYDFDKANKDGFIQLTETITEYNKKRALIKRKIDIYTKSIIMETKSFIDD